MIDRPLRDRANADVDNNPDQADHIKCGLSTDPEMSRLANSRVEQLKPRRRNRRVYIVRVRRSLLGRYRIRRLTTHKMYCVEPIYLIYYRTSMSTQCALLDVGELSLESIGM